MKKILFLAMLVTALASCSTEKSGSLIHDPGDQFEQSYIDASRRHSDGAQEQSLIMSESEFIEICRLEDEVLNIWTDEQLRYCMPVGERNDLSFEQKYSFLSQAIPDNLRAYNDGDIETYSLRSNAPARFDATPEIVAEVIAASGSIVGVKSSLNMWRPTYPYDNGQVTSFDVTRALSGVAQVNYLDYQVEVIPESIQGEFEVSGGNVLIAAAIRVNNTLGNAVDTIYYGSNTPNGPLIWNPNLGSPVEDFVIEGPLPYNIVSISVNTSPPLL